MGITLCRLRPSQGLAVLIRIFYGKGHRIGQASWRSGDAADCKSVYTGSIPVLASIASFPQIFQYSKHLARSKEIIEEVTGA